jgi:hypothetical protein
MFARLAGSGPGPIAPELEAAGLAAGFATDPDEAAADHQRWLAFEVLPWESVFLTEERLLGGDRASAIARETGSSDADHLAGALDHLALLCGAIADALEDEKNTSPLEERLDRFAAEHVGAWLPMLGRALDGAPGYGAAFALASELLASHTPPPRLPAAPTRDPLTGDLRAIADWLATPLATGVWWTQAEITGLGDELRLPIGFGTRTDRLEALLRNAADHRRASETVLAVLVRVRAWDSHWRERRSPWEERTRRAADLLERVRAQI